MRTRARNQSSALEASPVESQNDKPLRSAHEAVQLLQARRRPALRWDAPQREAGPAPRMTWAPRAQAHGSTARAREVHSP
eukprot:541674-Alexandrium_andersonii.AAC.1